MDKVESKSENIPNSEACCSRREFLLLASAAPFVSGQADTVTGTPDMTPSSLLALNYRKLLERADLSYDRPAARSEEGIPVGNGRMGSLVWTVPDALKFQINRVDVYGNDSYTNSFFERIGQDFFLQLQPARSSLEKILRVLRQNREEAPGNDLAWRRRTSARKDRQVSRLSRFCDNRSEVRMRAVRPHCRVMHRVDERRFRIFFLLLV